MDRLPVASLDAMFQLATKTTTQVVSIGRHVVFAALYVATLSSCAGVRNSESLDIARMPNGMPYSKSAYQAGRAEAEKDIRSGRLIIEDYGFPRKGQTEYAQILQKRYQIILRRVAGDIIDVKAVGHAIGYNAVSEPEIRRRFGDHILRAAEAEAAQRYEKKL